MQSFLARRMGRGPYWLLVVLNSVVALLVIGSLGFVLRHVMVGENGRPSSTAGLWLMHPLVLQLLHLPTLIGTIWRLHDTGHRSWPVWLGLSYLVSLVGLGQLAVWAAPFLRMPHVSAEQAVMTIYGFFGLQLVLAGILIRTIYLCSLRGDQGPNRYGPPPGGTPADDPPPSLLPEIAAPPAPVAKTAPKRAISSKPSFGKRGA